MRAWARAGALENSDTGRDGSVTAAPRTAACKSCSDYYNTRTFGLCYQREKNKRNQQETKFINVSDASCPFWPDVPCLSFRFEFLSIVFMGLHLFLVEVPTVPAKTNILTTVKALDILG